MKIIADENIKLLKNYFGIEHELILKPGRNITSQDVQDADMLLVRSITPVNKNLLENSNVKFVGSVTTGIDHLDTAWLDQANIKWSAAQGCNAAAVVDYVIATVALLQKMELLPHKNFRAGVIGVGKIGSQVAEKLKLLGADVLICDPPRALSDPDFFSMELNQLNDVDFITLHTPLITQGDYPTYHLIAQPFLQRLKKDCVILNTGRGSVVSFEDVKKYSEKIKWCFDVWENEPVIDKMALQLAVLATPHIAGYSVQSSYRSIDMIYQAACSHNIISPSATLKLEPPYATLSLTQPKFDWRDIVLQIYNPHLTTQQMQSVFKDNEASYLFDQMRKNFLARHEFAYIHIEGPYLSDQDKKLLSELGFILN